MVEAKLNEKNVLFILINNKGMKLHALKSVNNS
jgi:hypothetical protein